MRGKFPDLCSWTETLSLSVFGPETALSDAFLAAKSEGESEGKGKRKGILPWKAPNNGGVLGVSGAFLSGIADSIPVVGQLRRNTRMRQHGGKTYEDEQLSSWGTLVWVAGLVTVVGTGVGYAVKSGLISMSTSEAEKGENAGLGGFGEAGAVLGAYTDQSGNLTAEPVVQVDV